MKMYDEPKMEKLTINLPPVEIARIDALVEAGLYPSRTEFIRSSVRKGLDSYEKVINRQFENSNIEISEDDRKNIHIKKVGGVGVLGIGKKEMEKTIKEGKKYRIRVAGLFYLNKDITPELIEKGVESIKVYGTIKAPKDVKETLKKLKAK